MSEQVILEITDDDDAGWEVNGDDITIVGIDPRVSFFFLIFLIHKSLATFIVFIAFVLFFFILSLREYSLVDFLRAFRVYLGNFFGRDRRL
jgi:hypothetical protein